MDTLANADAAFFRTEGLSSLSRAMRGGTMLRAASRSSAAFKLGHLFSSL